MLYEPAVALVGVEPEKKQLQSAPGVTAALLLLEKETAQKAETVHGYEHQNG